MSGSGPPGGLATRPTGKGEPREALLDVIGYDATGDKGGPIVSESENSIKAPQFQPPGLPRDVSVAKDPSAALTSGACEGSGDPSASGGGPPGSTAPSAAVAPGPQKRSSATGPGQEWNPNLPEVSASDSPEKAPLVTSSTTFVDWDSKLLDLTDSVLHCEKVSRPNSPMSSKSRIPDSKSDGSYVHVQHPLGPKSVDNLDGPDANPAGEIDAQAAIHDLLHTLDKAESSKIARPVDVLAAVSVGSGSEVDANLVGGAPGGERVFLPVTNPTGMNQNTAISSPKASGLEHAPKTRFVAQGSAVAAADVDASVEHPMADSSGKAWVSPSDGVSEVMFKEKVSSHTQAQSKTCTFALLHFCIFAFLQSRISGPKNTSNTVRSPLN